MTTMTDPRVQSFIETIDACFAKAQELPVLTARHEAIFDGVPALKEQIDRDLAHDPVAAAKAGIYLLEMFDRFKAHHQTARLPYSPLLDARYPYRDESMNPILISALSDSPQRFGACEDPRREEVLPYIDPDADAQSRAAAYRDKLTCRTIVRDDLSDPREQVLVGQLGVFAARDLRDGECLGVYGGKLMSPAGYFACIDDSFILSAVSDDEFGFVDGENILAMANTRLAYDAQGLPIAQAEAGYNMKAVRFHAISRCGRRFSIGAFFAAGDVAKGAELRWNYGHSAQLVKQFYLPLYRAV
jgi:hypothetical protein